MVASRIDRRGVLTAAAAMLLAGCSIIPKTPAPTRAPAPAPTAEPSATVLPQDEGRHRVALLVPLTGDNGAVGQSIANATTMAILDTGAQNLRITTYDTAKGAREAAGQAIADGNALILGPLLGSNVGEVQAEARRARVPLVSFTNDQAVAGPDVFVMGILPEQSVARTMRHVANAGARDFAILAPEGDYGDRVQKAALDIARAVGADVATTERYARSNTSVVSAAERVRAVGGVDGVVIADGARLAAQGGSILKPGGRGTMQIIGTELWSGDPAILRSSALDGALFASVSDKLYAGFVNSYESRFGSKPYRIATLGYDAVLLTLRIARDWRVGRPFPVDQLRSSGGFTGVDGAFRFQRSGVVERAMEVRQINKGTVQIVSEAPAGF
ncbi:penicillin-binding protein activator [Qipengyuania sp.]|uniref:penicillin-binding protein activator n=1 Tax=Qipengyuania sp. TaxID=2004515 RepID=UPI0037368FF7